MELNLQIKAYAEAMQHEFDKPQNQKKEQWHECSADELLDNLEQNLDQLKRLVFIAHTAGQVNYDTILRRAANVGNFAWMVADVMAALPTPAGFVPDPEG